MSKRDTTYCALNASDVVAFTVYSTDKQLGDSRKQPSWIWSDFRFVEGEEAGIKAYCEESECGCDQNRNRCSYYYSVEGPLVSTKRTQDAVERASVVVGGGDGKDRLILSLSQSVVGESSWVGRRARWTGILCMQVSGVFICISWALHIIYFRQAHHYKHLLDDGVGKFKERLDVVL